jgi:tungstate transport system permease protein
VELIWQGALKALELLFTFDAEVWAITWLSIKISGSATLISLFLGVPFGIVLALSHFPGRSFVAAMVNTGMGLPPVVAGLFVSIFLWRSGPLGLLDLIYSPTAMVIAQVIIALPIIAGLTMAAFQCLDTKLSLQLLGIGASRAQLIWLLCKEARLPLLAAVMAGFGGVISEVGASMMVGGNIRGQTRVLTTATVLETGKGNFDVAMALSLILLALTFAVNFFLTRIQQREQLRWPRLS